MTSMRWVSNIPFLSQWETSGDNWTQKMYNYITDDPGAQKTEISSFALCTHGSF